MNGFLLAIEVQPRPGRGLLCYVFTLFTVALLAIAMADAPRTIRAAMTVSAATLLYRELRRRFSRNGVDRVERAVLWQDGSWRLVVAGRDPIRAQLAHAWGSSVGPVVALAWKCAGGRHRQAWLFRGDVPPSTWRRLRVRLRLA